MIAKVLRSDNVTYTLSYGQNSEKGGEVFYLNETLEGQTPKEMADDWLAIANKYSPMCYHIIISMSNGDTEKIRSIDNPADRVEFERNVIDAFMRELDQRGNNVFDCPFVVAHHENTDNEHFHISLSSQRRSMADDYVILSSRRMLFARQPRSVRNMDSRQHPVPCIWNGNIRRLSEQGRKILYRIRLRMRRHLSSQRAE
jgi:hypothetical protein